MGIRVNEIKTVEVLTTDGQTLKKGDGIVLRIKTEDIVCSFQEVNNGYFVTETLDGQSENKYRQGSIETCFKLKSFEVDKQEASQEAGQDAAEPADNGALAPATE